MVRSGRVMQMKSCIIKYDLSVCRIFSFFCFFFVHTARSSTVVVRQVYMLLFEIEISDVRFFRFGCDFGRRFGRDLGFCLRFDFGFYFGFGFGCPYAGCIRFAFGILNALIVLNALVILHACTHSIIVRD